MRRTPPRRRLSLVVVVVGLTSLVMAGSAQAVDAGRDQAKIGSDGRGYTAPHAGLLAPPRAAGRLAPASGALIGTHSDDSPTSPLDAAHQGILRTEESAGRTL